VELTKRPVIFFDCLVKIHRSYLTVSKALHVLMYWAKKETLVQYKVEVRKTGQGVSSALSKDQKEHAALTHSFSSFCPLAWV